jgi:hypothetical protein
MQIRLGWAQTEFKLAGSYDGPLTPHVEIVITELGYNAAIGPNNTSVTTTWPVAMIDELIAQLEALKKIDAENRQAYKARLKGDDA